MIERRDFITGMLAGAGFASGCRASSIFTGGGRALLINWEDHEAEMVLDFPELPEKARDFWRGREISVPQKTVLPPHSCLLLEW